MNQGQVVCDAHTRSDAHKLHKESPGYTLPARLTQSHALLTCKGAAVRAHRHEPFDGKGVADRLVQVRCGPAAGQEWAGTQGKLHRHNSLLSQDVSPQPAC